MAKRPKRRKYKDNPYTLLHDEENNTYYANNTHKPYWYYWIYYHNLILFSKIIKLKNMTIILIKF